MKKSPNLPCFFAEMVATAAACSVVALIPCCDHKFFQFFDTVVFIHASWDVDLSSLLHADFAIFHYLDCCHSVSNVDVVKHCFLLHWNNQCWIAEVPILCQGQSCTWMKQQWLQSAARCHAFCVSSTQFFNLWEDCKISWKMFWESPWIEVWKACNWFDAKAFRWDAASARFSFLAGWFQNHALCLFLFIMPMTLLRTQWLPMERSHSSFRWGQNLLRPCKCFGCSGLNVPYALVNL